MDLKNLIKRSLFVTIIYTIMFCGISFAQFGNQQIIDSTIYGIKEIISTDLNNDNFDDLIIAQDKFQNDNISFYPNLNGQQFGPKQNIAKLSSTPNSVASGDLNNDGWIDIVTITLDQDSSVLWYPNNSGSFPTEILLDTNIISPENLEIVDIDNDMDLDIVVLGHVNILTYINDGTGNFTKTITPNLANEYYEFFICDIDGDNFKDIIIGSADVLIYKNSNNNFTYDTLRSESIINNGFIFLVYLNDLDNDGDNDLIIDGNFNDEIRYYLNDGNGFFSFSQTIEITDQCKSVIAKDFDNDGDNDILASLYQEGEIVWYENMGSGAFASKHIIDYGRPVHTTEVHSFDINNDNTMDIVWAHPLSFNLNLFPVNIEEFRLSEILIYPNPSAGKITLESNLKGKVTIYNVLGRKLSSSLSIEKGKNLLDLKLPAQTYILELQSENGSTQFSKFIIK